MRDRRTPGSLATWLLTDGKAGDEGQCLGVAERLGLVAEVRRVAPRKPWAWLMPWGPPDPREGPGHGPLTPCADGRPWPDLLLASGRRAVSSVRAVRRASGGRTFTVFLKDPRTGAGTADLIWVPEHDALRGPNVLATLTSPHRLSPARLAAARADPPAALAALPGLRVTVLLGGNSRHHRVAEADAERLLANLAVLAGEASLMGTASRRTPPDLAARARALVEAAGGWWWDGTGANPYAALLALADAVVVTADSVNMLDEAAATGAPVLVAAVSGGHPRLDAHLAGLERLGVARPFRGRLEGARYPPLDATDAIARAVAHAMAARGTPI